MKISKEFGGFFFGAVCKQLKEGAIERFKKTGKGMGYVHPYTRERIYFDMRFVDDDVVYQFFKQVNPNYPKDETGLTPLSTKKIDSATMTKHIQWIERWGALNGIEMPYIVEAWKKILLEAGIEKDK
jgi:hypothetical protein